MSKPEDIPQDLWSAANAAFEQASLIADDDKCIAIFAQAILAERERCAKIAAEFPYMGEPMGREIAAIIRVGSR